MFVKSVETATADAPFTKCWFLSLIYLSTWMNSTKAFLWQNEMHRLGAGNCFELIGKFLRTEQFYVGVKFFFSFPPNFKFFYRVFQEIVC